MNNIIEQDRLGKTNFNVELILNFLLLPLAYVVSVLFKNGTWKIVMFSCLIGLFLLANIYLIWNNKRGGKEKWVYSIRVFGIFIPVVLYIAFTYLF